MNIIGVQFDIAWEDKTTNFARVRALLTASPPPADALVVLPEMFATGFSMAASKVAEPKGGETEQFLADCARTWRLYLLAGLAQRGANGRARNVAVAYAPDGRRLVTYAKQRLFTPGDEPAHYVPGTRWVTFAWGTCTVAPFICYDLRFPELFRATAEACRPELFAVLANFPAKRIGHWLTLLRARAVENQAYVVGVNRIGQDPVHTYNGHSVIISPDGEILADAGETATCIQATVDLANLKKYRTGLPFLADLPRPLSRTRDFNGAPREL